MRWILPLLLLVGGCGAAMQPRTASPDDFLYAFRCGAMPGEHVGTATATYEGSDQAYHYVSISGGSPSTRFIGEMTGPQKLRCRLDQLPRSFPQDFRPLQGVESVEVGEDTRQYVQDYLARHRDEIGPLPGAANEPAKKP